MAATAAGVTAEVMAEEEMEVAEMAAGWEGEMAVAVQAEVMEEVATAEAARGHRTT